ncbi:MAG: hypothetical protein AAF569_07985 [Pseudomonadota bacterium]
MAFWKPHFKNSFLSLFLSFALTACLDPEAVNKKIVTDQERADSALQAIEPSKQIRKPLVIDDRPWYGARAVPLQNGLALPSRFQGADGIVITFERPMTLRETARMIQAATAIRTVVSSSLSDASGAPEPTFIPVDGIEVTGGRVVWKGLLSGILEQLTDSFDADWTYDGRTLTISDEVTRTFMLHALADTIELQSDIENSISEQSALPEVGTSSQATLEIWNDIQSTIDAIINQRGRASYSPTTGTITVSGPASTVRKIEEYLRDQNRMRLRRVAVAVKVLSVETSDTNTLGFNLTGLIENAISNRPFQFTSVSDGLTAGILRTLPTIDPVTGVPVASGGVSADSDEITSIIEASEDVERVSLSNSGAIVTLSDIPAPLQIGRTVAYLERVSSSSGDDGNVSLEPGEVNLGLTMNVLPRVIQRDKVLLRLAVGITDAQTPFQQITVSGLTIELPEISTTGFLQNAVLSEGETLVLAGFEKDQASLDDEGTPGGLFTGGTRTIGRSREVTVLLITAEVLPEEPLTVLGR